MDTTHLKYFVAVAHTLSFSEAARRCGISQPSISHSISELEKQLHTTLFNRSRKSVSLTETGQALLPRALEILELDEKTELEIRQLDQGRTGNLSISALSTSSAPLSKCLSVFSARYPDIITDISFTSGRSQAQVMNENKYDFYFAVKEMVPQGDTFDYLVSNTDHLCMAFPADHPLADQPLDFEKLKDERFICISAQDGPVLSQEIDHVCRTRGYEPNVVCQYDRAEAVLLSVSAGIGISIIPEALKNAAYSENVRFVRIPGRDAERTYVIAWRRDSSNPAARIFLDVVKELYV